MSDLTMPQLFSGGGYAVMMVILVLFAGIVLSKLRTMDLRDLVSEPPPAGTQGPGKASLSRFQFLLFTFLVAGLFVVLSLEAGTFVEIPNGVVALMGVSGGSFVISKAIGNGEKPAASGAQGGGAAGGGAAGGGVNP